MSDKRERAKDWTEWTAESAHQGTDAAASSVHHGIDRTAEAVVRGIDKVPLSSSEAASRVQDRLPPQEDLQSRVETIQEKASNAYDRAGETVSRQLDRVQQVIREEPQQAGRRRGSDIVQHPPGYEDRDATSFPIWF